MSVPAKLLRQRPDVQAAEALLHQASANVGVATANLFPQINLTGAIGSDALSAGNLFTGGTGTWTVGASLAQPLFHGGELLHKRRAALADLDNSAAQYRQTVLAAMQDVADTLRALEADARNLRAEAAADDPPPSRSRSARSNSRRAASATCSPWSSSVSIPRPTRISCWPRPPAMPIPPRSTRRSAAAGGIAKIKRSQEVSNVVAENNVKRHETAVDHRVGCGGVLLEPR